MRRVRPRDRSLPTRQFVVGLLWRRMRRLRAINIAFFIVGLVCLVVLVVHTGPRTIGAGLAKVGYVFPLVCLAHFYGIVADAVMWWACCSRKTRIRDTLRASLAGHAINEATPLAKLGELTKFSMLAETVPAERAAAALIVQNITMGILGCATIAIGAVVSLVIFPLDDAFVPLMIGAASVFGLITVFAILLFRVGVGTWPFRLLARFGVSGERLERWQSRWEKVEGHWHTVTRDRTAMAINWTAGLVSRSAEFSQAAIILNALGSDQVLAAAVMNVAGYQLIYWTTSFIPMQMGSAEAGTVALFQAAGLSPNSGLLLELVRRLRRFTFIGVGVSVLGSRAFRTILAQKEKSSD